MRRPHLLLLGTIASVLHGGGRGTGAPFPAVDQATRTELGRPRSSLGHMGVMLLRCTTRNAFIRRTATGRPGRSTKRNARGQDRLRRTVPLPPLPEPNRETGKCSPSPPCPPASATTRIWKLKR